MANGQGYYTFGGWLRLSTGSTATGVKVLINDSNGNHSYSKYSTVNSTGWTNVYTTQNIRWSGTLNSAVLYVEMNTSDTSLPGIYFDDFSLLKQ